MSTITSLAAMDLESLPNSIIQPSVPRPLKKLYQGEPMALGIPQILVGIPELTFGLAIVQGMFYGWRLLMAAPYWMGILYIISGSLSVAAAKNPKITLVKGMVGMSVVSAVAASIATMILSVPVARHRYVCSPYYDYGLPPEICHEFIAVPHDQVNYMSAVLLAFTVLEFLISIVTAAFGCASVCRTTYSETTIVIFQNSAEGATPAPALPV